MSRDQLSDNWRRTICRCAFLIFCVLPTLMTGYWIFHPQTAGQWEQAIRAELGIATEIDSVETPGPHVTILRGFRLTDPEMGELFATTQVRVIRGFPNRIVIDYPTTVSCQSLTRLISKSSEHLVGSPLGGATWRIEFAATTTISPEQPSRYTPSLVAEGLQIELAQYENGPAAELQFRLIKDYPTNNVVRGFVYRCIGQSPQFELHTVGNPLPCWLLADLVPDLRKLGDACEFDGTIMPVQQPSERPSCKITGTFTNIDLARLILPYKQVLTGTCAAIVENLEIQDGQIFSLSAKVGCRSGQIGAQLLSSATTNLGFQTAPGLLEQAAETPIDFRSFELVFRLDAGRVAFEAFNQGVVAWDPAGNPIIGYSGTEDRSLDDLAMFLVQPDAADERLTEDMLALLRRFHRPAPPLRTADRDVSQNY